MDQLNEYFFIKHSEDLIFAEIHCTQAYHDNQVEVNKEELLQFLRENKIVHGILDKHVDLCTSARTAADFPILICKGTPVQHGEPGRVEYELNFSAEIEKNENWNFRDVMRIPSVKKGQKLATVIPPTKGVDGTNIYGHTIRAKPGKPALVSSGKNVLFQEETLSFYATADGQVSVNGNIIDVHEVYEVRNTLSMKDGNLNFVGSIVIHGDVPSGYSVKALGDVKIFGMVEAAQVTAGGSIYISEGLSGLQKGYIHAEENIHIGYINQGIVYAGNDLFVENSIIHSVCTVSKKVLCQRGNIIGGSLSVGEGVEAKEIGNKLSTKTEIIFGVNKAKNKQEEQLIAKKEELKDTLEKLTVIGNKLKERNDLKSNPKIKIAWLRQQHSFEQTTRKLEEIERILMTINSGLGDEKKAELIVNNHLYPNVIVGFGKYKRLNNSVHHQVQVKLEHNEIVVHGL